MSHKKCQKSQVPIIFRRTYALSVGFKMKPLIENVFSCVMVKTSSNYAVKVVKRSSGSIFNCLVNHFAQTSVLFNMSLIEHLLFNRINRTYFVNLWKMSDIGSLINSCIGLIKTQFSPVSIININMMTRNFIVRLIQLICLIYIKKYI